MKSMRIKKKYFLDEEFHETLSNKKIYNPSFKIIKKDYVYKTTGSKYSGEWLGGFRHGFGIMQWPDGAKYEGQWELGRA